MKSVTHFVSPEIQRVTLLNHGIEQALSWVEDTRSQAPRFALEAQTVGLNLRRSRIRLNRLAKTASQRDAIGFYGHAQAAKTHLLTELVAADPGYLTCVFAGKTLDFLTHIRPGHTAAGIAIRFSPRLAPQEADFPVQLALLTEGELISILAQAVHEPPLVEEAQLAETIGKLTKLRQPQATAGFSADDMLMLWDSLRVDDNTQQHLWDTAYWPHVLAIGPYLVIDDRVRLFSPLWNNDPVLTECYRRLAYRLEQLDHAPGVMAPLSVLTDENQQPTLGILSANDLSASEEKVQLKRQDNRIITIALSELSLLTAELLIPLPAASPHRGLTHLDFLDLPTHEVEGPSLSPAFQRLQQAKSLRLLQRYSEQQAMHTLLVCHAATCREEVLALGPALDHWLQQRSAQSAGGHPGLIWAFTSREQRVTGHYDQALQRYVGEPGEVWGTLLARDEDDIRRMIDYLATSAEGDLRENRLRQQLRQLEQDLLDNQLGRWLNLEDSDKTHIAKTTVKALQARTNVHGELLESLLPPRHALQQLYCQQPQSVRQNSDPLSIAWDLFDEHQDLTSALESDANVVHQVQQLWITQLRHLPDNAALLRLLAVEPGTLATLADELITASFRLDLWQRLEHTLAQPEHKASNRAHHIERQIASTLTVLGDFIAWLGFHSQPLVQRPESRVNRGQKIFTKPCHQASARLTQLPTEPVNNTALYIYDWLVGLYTLIGDNSGYGVAQTLSEQQRERLARIIQQMR